MKNYSILVLILLFSIFNCKSDKKVDQDFETEELIDSTTLEETNEPVIPEPEISSGSLQ